MPDPQTTEKRSALLTRSLIAAALFAALAGCVAFAYLIYSDDTYAHISTSGAPLGISEIVSSNDLYPDRNGRLCDFIELYNASDRAVSLEGYNLTDNMRKVRYSFGDGASIGAGAYLLVYCEKNGGDGYADFSIARTGGEDVFLIDNRNNVVDQVRTLPLRSNEAMVREADGAWSVCAYATPGFENTETGFAAWSSAHSAPSSPIRINELMSNNRGYPSPDGALCDWIELYNAGDTAAAIGGYTLTDDPLRGGYVFPDGTHIEPDGYLLVCCDGDALSGAYAPFSLARAGGESVTLTNGGGLELDSVTTQPLPANGVLARQTDGSWLVSDRPTPGFANSEAGYSAYLASLGQNGLDVRVTEVMPANKACLADADGDFSDWIELTNYGRESVDLAGWHLSDRLDDPMRCALPAHALAPGERVIVFASGKTGSGENEIHASFSLDSAGETVTLATPQGRVVSRLGYESALDDQSYQTDEESGQVAASDRPSPGFANTDEGYEAFLASLPPPASLSINEAMADNATYLRQRRNVYYDWVELKNNADAPLLLSDYYLSDDADEKTQHRLPDRTLDPGRTLVLYCTSGETVVNRNGLFLPLALDAARDRLYLYDAQGRLTDYLSLVGLPYQGSRGRLPDRTGLFYFAVPTPESENKGGAPLTTKTPAASAPEGVYADSRSLTVTLDGEGAIYYTTDGSEPTAAAARYEEPLTFTGPTVLRAACLREGRLMSEIATWHYFINVTHSLPIIGVATDPPNLYDTQHGILAPRNIYTRDFAKFAHVSYFGDNGSFSLDCDLELHGASTRARKIKQSFKITFRARYGGESALSFPLFDGDSITSFRSLLLRNGEDYSRAFVRDELMASLVHDRTDSLLTQNGRYCVLYLNGRYDGIYCIKETISAASYASHFNVTSDSVSVQRAVAPEGTEFYDLIEYARKHRLSDPAHYAYMAERINLDSVIDWCIIEAYCANPDLSVNVRYLKSSEDGGKWRYALYDLDYGLSGPATFEYVLSDGQHGVIPDALLDNAEFRDRFLKRMAVLLTDVLTPERLHAQYEALVASVEDEMPAERARWGRRSYEDWFEFLRVLERNLDYDRKTQMVNSIADHLHIRTDDVWAYFPS